MKPVLTVILPVLNGMPYLRAALASLEAQTLRDFEVVLWDNGSTDGTVEEAGQWIPSRLPGRVVTGEPLPLQQCLARMVQEAETPLVARMDADDISLPHRFEEQVRFLKEHPEVSLVGCQIECMDREGSLMPKESWANYPVTHQDLVTTLLFNCPFCHPSILFRAEAVRQIGNYATPAPVEDLDLYLRLTQTAIVANLPTVGLHYRIHPASICSIASKDNRHAELSLATVTRHVKDLFGLDPATYLQLRNKAHPVVIVPLLRSAFYRARGQWSLFFRIMGTPTFLYIGRCLTGKGDLVSRLAFRVLALFATPSSP